ncbi:HAD family hydrolase [Sporosarcina sp.]|uniref:HAD family hydrolase n=1 Tax=Sporosarcina sp. TaxID=49982 RepID=UPI00261FD564|nr:HAD family hydrolase [Sporosarcina sp.]
MMFASDLDRTLIYSHKFFESEQISGHVRNVEKLNGKEISFMTEKAIVLLQELAKEMMFVPVTTRTIEQYNRVTLFQHEIRPFYAITCNGGVVLENGEVDRYWQDHIKNKIKNGAISVEDVKRKIEETSDASWLKSIRVVDQFFVYLVINTELTPHELMGYYSKWAAEHGWIFSLQGRKVYFIPSFINKWDATRYVADKEGKSRVYTAGDSNLDVCLIEQADFGIIPRHGEAAVDFSHLELTKKTGVLASEEIIETILSKRRNLIMTHR